MDAVEAVKAIDTEIEVLARERVLRAERERAATRRRRLESLAAQVEGAKSNLAHAEGQGLADAEARFTKTVTEWAERNPGRHFMLGYTDELTLPIVSYVRYCQNIVQQRKAVADLSKQLEAEQGTGF